MFDEEVQGRSRIVGSSYMAGFLVKNRECILWWFAEGGWRVGIGGILLICVTGRARWTYPQRDIDDSVVYGVFPFFVLFKGILLQT
jgi:hypothetical protein